ncbi:MAG: protein kinase [Verrucomicrobiaceae bacterium]|nr:protein kinase [Verrucomicrobiaceae bacterium]
MNSIPSREEAIFKAALELGTAEERAALLDRECGEDAALRAEVESLLAAMDDAGSFLANPVAADLDVTIKAVPGTLPSQRVLPPSEKSGDRIGPYKLLQEIGQGGFGTVWMADQEQPVRRRVALKIIKLGMDTKEVVARFEQERQALAMMDHPNIARVFDAGATEQGRPFFVMELVRGMKITDYCDEKGLSTAERVELFILVCQAVQHAHQKGIIHRDLKPSNILVTVNDGKAVPKVIDFGVAKATQGKLADGTLFTQFEQMVGTPLYMSPEQAEMTSLDVDTRSDIYSLGVLLYELLTGRTPIDTATFAKAGMGEIRRIIREVDPVLPSARLKTLDGNTLSTTAKRRHTDPAKLPGTLRGDIDWIVMKCLEKDRARRYDTANGLAMDLQRHLANEVVVARPPTAAYLLSKLIRRNKVAFAAGTAIAASLVIGIAASVWQAVRATQAEKKAVTAFDELRATAPAFAEQARGLAAKEQYADAIAKLDYAIKLRPDAAEFLVAKGDLLQCQLRLAPAAAIYRDALRVQPGHARAE